jgi:thymidylate kinase
MIRILGIQIPKFWEVIKFIALNSDQIDPKYHDAYCINLLIDLLSGKKQCYIVKNSEGKISIVFILYFYFNKYLDTTVMQVSNAYSFEQKGDVFWRKSEEGFRKIAEQNNVKVVVIETSNKSAIALLNRANTKPSSEPVTRFTYFL